MLAIVYITGFVGSIISLGLYIRDWNKNLHDDLVQPLHFSVITFVAINILISIWEIALFIHHDVVLKQYADISVFQALSLKHWTIPWSTYSLMDISYCETGSFGFNIDVGNGFTTLLPNLIFLVCSSMNFHSRTVGFFCALFFYQGLYGTVIYFFQYFYNERYKLNNTAGLIPIVIVANITWIVGPLLCLYGCYRMVLDDSVNVFFE